MQKLRSIHLYLGCMFAPMLLFFAASGIWQTYDPGFAFHSKMLGLLSTIHMGGGLKSGESLSSPFLRVFILAMSASFIISTILGVVMALKFGRSRRAAWVCLALGVLLPLTAVLIRVFA